MKFFFPLLVLSSVASMLAGLACIEINGAVHVDPERVLSARYMTGMLLVLPFVETFAIQWLVVESALLAWKLVSGQSGGRAITMIGAGISAILFAWVHFAMNGSFNGFTYGIEGGIILGSMYAFNRVHGRQQAFFWTWMLHAASNGLLLLSLTFFNAVIP